MIWTWFGSDAMEQDVMTIQSMILFLTGTYPPCTDAFSVFTREKSDIILQNERM